MGHQNRTYRRDPLTEVLRDLRLSESCFFRSELSAPWGLRLPSWEGASYHFVAEGSCWVRCDGAEPATEMTAGDFVLLPHGKEHELLDLPGSPVEAATALPNERISELGLILRHGGGGSLSVVISGSFRWEPHPLIALLPDILSVQSSCEQREPWIATILATLATEVSTPRPGSETMITRMSDMLVVGAIRAWVESSSRSSKGWLGALHEEGIGTALLLIHGQAQEPWTLETLAEEAHMSRATFAQKFKQSVGTSPMLFLTQRRMQLATRWLQEDKLALADVAHRLGYASEASFHRAFKRVVGVPPGSLRRRQNPPSNGERFGAPNEHPSMHSSKS